VGVTDFTGSFFFPENAFKYGRETEGSTGAEAPDRGGCNHGCIPEKRQNAR